MRFILFIYLLCAWCLPYTQPSSTLPAWETGFLDIHHISTGRGNATYLVLPDGTTMLIDAGDISETHPRTTSSRNSVLRPTREKSATGWIVDYIRQFTPTSRQIGLDYAMITHYHDDHFGEWDENRPLSSNGAYVLTGIMAVGDQIPIRTLIDRGSEFPVNIKSAEFRDKERGDAYHIIQTLDEYWKFIDWHAEHRSMRHETLEAGASTQIVLKNDAEAFPSFLVRNIAVNGRVWTGYAEMESYNVFDAGEYPGENPLSTCIKISYGMFDYFTGGDISGIAASGEGDFDAMESHIAPVVGPVDVATLNHHGNRDSQNSFYVRTLRPRVWIGQTWSSDHPGHEVLQRISSHQLYPGERDLFATDFLEPNAMVIGESVDRHYKSRHGHIVVRVSPGGGTYYVFVLDDLVQERTVLKSFGPYASR